MPSLGPWELMLILGVALLIFGPAKLPQLGSALGRTVREFRQASSGALSPTTQTQVSAKDDPAAVTTDSRDH